MSMATQDIMVKLDVLDRLHRLPETALLTTDFAASFSSTSVSSMERMRVNGSGPDYSQGGARVTRGTNQKCLYMKSDLLAWHAANKVTSSMKAAIRNRQV
jgi:hypothetical protein